MEMDNLWIALVMDRSAQGVELAAQTRRQFPEFDERHAFWMATDYEFMIYVKSAAAEGQLVLFVNDAAMLEAQAIAEVTKKVHDYEGVAAFMLGIAPALVPRIQEAIEQAGKPFGWTTGGIESEVRPSTGAEQSTEGLLDLAVAPTGKEIDYNRLQIVDRAAFEAVSDTLTTAASVAVERTAASRSFEQFRELLTTPRATAQEDGRLVVEIAMPGGVARTIEVPKGGWKELGEAEYRQLVAQIERTMTEEASAEDLVRQLADGLLDNAKARRASLATLEAAAASAQQLIMIYDRSATSLGALRTLTAEYAELRPHADRWLATGDAYLMCSIGAGDDSYWSAQVPSYAMLLEDLLPELAESTSAGQTLLYSPWLDAERRNVLEQAWAGLGGLCR